MHWRERGARLRRRRSGWPWGWAAATRSGPASAETVAVAVGSTVGTTVGVGVGVDDRRVDAVDAELAQVVVGASGPACSTIRDAHLRDARPRGRQRDVVEAVAVLEVERRRSQRRRPLTVRRTSRSPPAARPPPRRPRSPRPDRPRSCARRPDRAASRSSWRSPATVDHVVPGRWSIAAIDPQPWSLRPVAAERARPAAAAAQLRRSAALSVDVAPRRDGHRLDQTVVAGRGDHEALVGCARTQ